MSGYNDQEDNFQSMGDFNDSFHIQPISLKPSVLPSILNKSNPQNTILAAYDSSKLIEYIDPVQEGKIIEIINLEQSSLTATLTEQGSQFLTRFSGHDVAFATVIGQNQSGKSFFLDKILNLSNIQGNNFCSIHRKPGIYLWSIPFVKDEIRFFIMEVANCSVNSNEFKALLPFLVTLSSTIVTLQPFKDSLSTPKCVQGLNIHLNDFLRLLDFGDIDDQSQKAAILRSIFPSHIIQILRQQKLKSPPSIISLPLTTLQTVFLPNAKNPSYRGADQDLKIHSFLNKNCISQSYIRTCSQIFMKIYNSISEKKYKDLVFNGNIILKYIKQLEPSFHRKKTINLDQVYDMIVRDLYVSAYNYCVICYHQMLEQALADQKPRSLDQILQIFQISTKQVFEKYNQFTLDKNLHLQFEQKLLSHIDSKESLILEINKKKTDLQLTQIYQKNLNLNDIPTIEKQIIKLNKQHPSYSHGRDQTVGRKLSQVISRLGSGNNIDYRALKEIQRLRESVDTRKKQLATIKQDFKVKNLQKNQKLKEEKQLDKNISKITRQIQIYEEAGQQDPSKLKEEKAKYQQKIRRNDEIIKKLKQQMNEPIQNNAAVIQGKKRIKKVIDQQQLLNHMLKEISQLQKAPQGEGKQGKGKAETKMKKQPANQNSKIKESQSKQKPKKSGK